MKLPDKQEKEEIRNKNLTGGYLLLIVLILAIILLMILFSKVTYTESFGKQSGLSSLSLWKPFRDVAQITNLSENESLIEKNKQAETPSDATTIKEVFKQYWVSYLILLLIAVLIILWILVVFRIHNG
jgi:uncharacterized integral membrane protein